MEREKAEKGVGVVEGGRKKVSTNFTTDGREMFARDEDR